MQIDQLMLVKQSNQDIKDPEIKLKMKVFTLMNLISSCVLRLTPPHWAASAVILVCNQDDSWKLSLSYMENRAHLQPHSQMAPRDRKTGGQADQRYLCR